MKKILTSLLLGLALLLPLSSTSYAQACMDKKGLEAAITENLGPQVTIYQSMFRLEAEAFFTALKEIAPQMPDPPEYDEVHIVPDGAVAIIVVMKSGCVQGAARVPALLYMEARKKYKVAN
jgi:hypothetical protein